MIPHLHDPCIYCGTPHDEVEAGDCPGPEKFLRDMLVDLRRGDELGLWFEIPNDESRKVAAIFEGLLSPWRPIVDPLTLPADGVLAWGEEYGHQVVWYDPHEPDGNGIWTANRESFIGKENWCWATKDGPSLHRDCFTHWMPLRSGPAPRPIVHTGGYGTFIPRAK